MKTLSIGIAALALMLVGCETKAEKDAAAKAVAEETAAAQRAAAGRAEAAKVEAFVNAGKDMAASGLKDPSSAQFRRLRVGITPTPKPLRVLCGEMNGKNGYGAYAGFFTFISFEDKTVKEGMSYMLSHDDVTVDEIERCLADRSSHLEECQFGKFDRKFWGIQQQFCSKTQPYAQTSGKQ
jgi:hypothetical protein